MPALAWPDARATSTHLALGWLKELMNQTSTSLWTASSTTPRYEPLRGEIDVDVAIIGAGITGLTAALLLAGRGRSVAVIEKETIGGGATAQITEAIDARYHYIRRKYSGDDARLVADAGRAAIETIAELVDKHSIDCRFRRVPGYLYTERRKYVAELKNEAAAAREAGLDARWTGDVPLPFETRGAVVFANQARLHPGEYAAALAERVVASDGKIYEGTRATDVKEHAVTTDAGLVRARAVFVTATQVPDMTAPYRTHALAFEVSGEHPDGLFRDTADPYHSVCWQETSAGTFAIIGGEAHRAGDEGDADGAFARLQSYASETFGAREPRYRWSQPIIEAHAGLPVIGVSRGVPKGEAGNIYISTGYGGQEMTFGTIGAMLVADLITGIDNRWKDVFSPSRVRPRMTAREFLSETTPALPPLERVSLGDA